MLIAGRRWRDQRAITSEDRGVIPEVNEAVCRNPELIQMFIVTKGESLS
jgi:hypothetical protein